jgi:hypothetical protein
MAILHKHKCLFFRNGEQEGKTGPVWGLAPECVMRQKERVWRVNMVEIYVLMCENGKLRNAETILRMGERR